jgi:hypothetical protein
MCFSACESVDAGVPPLLGGEALLAGHSEHRRVADQGRRVLHQAVKSSDGGTTIGRKFDRVLFVRRIAQDLEMIPLLGYEFAIEFENFRSPR